MPVLDTARIPKVYCPAWTTVDVTSCGIKYPVWICYCRYPVGELASFYYSLAPWVLIKKNGGRYVSRATTEQIRNDWGISTQFIRYHHIVGWALGLWDFEFDGKTVIDHKDGITRNNMCCNIQTRAYGDNRHAS